MLYMHKETFDIVSRIPVIIEGVQYADVKNNPQDYFEIDELIALPVQVLNRKGYITTGCCAGHQFDDKIYDILKINPHICFKKGISLPSLPPGFVKDDSYQDNLFIENISIPSAVKSLQDIKFPRNFNFLRDVLEAMEKLYEWALNLPDFEN